MQNNNSALLIDCLIKQIPKKCLLTYGEYFLDKNIENHLEIYENIISRFTAISEPKTNQNEKNQLNTAKNDTSSKNQQKTKTKNKNKKKMTNVMNIGTYLPENAASSEENLVTALEQTEIFGRQKCDCLGMKHSLVNNCLSCGRIICSLEGEGPCFTCKNPVTRKQTSFPPESGYHQAVKVRNRLLEQQNRKKENTRVLDDQADYFSYENKWLGSKLRHEIKKIEETDGKQNHVVIDLLNEKVDVVEIDDYIEKLKTLKDDIEEPQTTNPYDLYKKLHNNDIIPDIKLQTECIPIENDPIISPNISFTTSFCLKIQQPWASWIFKESLEYIPYDDFCDFRGPVWIVSDTNKTEAQKLLNIASQLNINVSKNQSLNISKNFPHGVVLGKLEITDCFYRTKLSDENPLFDASSLSFLIKCEQVKPLKYAVPLKLGDTFSRIPPFIQNILDVVFYSKA